MVHIKMHYINTCATTEIYRKCKYNSQVILFLCMNSGMHEKWDFRQYAAL